MRVGGARVGLVSIPLVRPFVTALRTVRALESVVVQLVGDDGVVGWGEAPPTPVITGDTRGGIIDGVGLAMAAIRDVDLADWGEVQDRLSRCMVHNTSAKAAVDLALHDLAARAAGVRLVDWLGGAVRGELITDLTISVGPVDDMVAASVEAVEAGFGILKIKVGTDAVLDVVRLREIRAAVGPEVALRLDANQGWSAPEAIGAITELEDAGVDMELVEQPVPAEDFDGLAQVTAAVATPILADEAVFTPRDAAKIINERAADMINIKLMKTGGIHQARRIIDLATEAGVPCMLGAMMESAVSITGAAHLALASECITMIDLDPPLLCAANPVQGGLQWQGPRLWVPDAPGSGIETVEGVRWLD